MINTEEYENRSSELRMGIIDNAPLWITISELTGIINGCGDIQQGINSLRGDKVTTIDTQEVGELIWGENFTQSYEFHEFIKGVVDE